MVLAIFSDPKESSQPRSPRKHRKLIHRPDQKSRWVRYQIFIDRRNGKRPLSSGQRRPGEFTRAIRALIDDRLASGHARADITNN